MVVARVLLLCVVLGAVAGCRFSESAPPQAPEVVAEDSVSRAESSAADPADPAASAVPDPAPPSPGDVAPPADVALAGEGLVVTVGGESLRLGPEAVRAVERIEDAYMGPTLAVVLTDAAAERFAEMTGANVGKQVVVTLDGGVLIALTVQGRITDGQLPVPVGPGGPEDLERRVREAVAAR